MTTKDVFEGAAAQPALIVCRTGATESLWDCHVSNLIERLEDELGVVVTGADPGQRTPSLRSQRRASSICRGNLGPGWRQGLAGHRSPAQRYAPATQLDYACSSQSMTA